MRADCLWKWSLLPVQRCSPWCTRWVRSRAVSFSLMSNDLSNNITSNVIICCAVDTILYSASDSLLYSRRQVNDGQSSGSVKFYLSLLPPNHYHLVATEQSNAHCPHRLLGEPKPVSDRGLAGALMDVYLWAYNIAKPNREKHRRKVSLSNFYPCVHFVRQR